MSRLIDLLSLVTDQELLALVLLNDYKWVVWPIDSKLNLEPIFPSITREQYFEQVIKARKTGIILREKLDNHAPYMDWECSYGTWYHD